MTMDVTKAIEPKSDQLNADDLLTGPRTIRIRDVKVRAGQEQPVWIYFDGDNNKPWKPSKTGTRTLAAIWGADASKWVGLHCTIYCDPEVTWGGMKVGGIRVSHMEGLTSPRTLMLTKTRGKKGVTVIKPMVIEKTDSDKAGMAIDKHAPDESELARQMESVANDPEARRKWWTGLSKDEQAVVRGLVAKKDAGDE